MSADEIKKLKLIAEKTRKEARTKQEIHDTFLSAGIVDSKGKLKHPYKSIFDPQK